MKDSKIIIGDIEVLHGYFGLGLKLNDRPISFFEKFDDEVITPEEKGRILTVLRGADMSVFHNADYDKRILGFILGEPGETTIPEIKEFNDRLIKRKVSWKELNTIDKGFRNKGVNFLCSMVTMCGVQGFTGLKVLQNAFNLTVDKTEFTDDLRYSERFKEYFINDIETLYQIWLKHWSLYGTYKNRIGALKLLGMDPKLAFLPLYKYIGAILKLDGVEPVLDDFLKHEYKFVKAPGFMEHLSKNIKKDDNEKTEVEYKDNDVVYSSGGIHSVHKYQKLFKTDNDGSIWHIDVQSLYPSIIEVNKDKFKFLNIDRYLNMKVERLEYKHSGKKEESDSFKLVLNGSYGVINSSFGEIGCKEAGKFICNEGHRLLLAMLDQLDYTGIKYDLIQLNTDGVYIKTHDKNIPEMKKAIKAWEKEESMSMDYEKYDVMYQADVNNYIAIESDGGKVHRKGRFNVNFKAYHSTMLPATCRDMCISLLKGEEFTGDIIGIFDKKTTINYYLTREDTGLYLKTPKGNKSKVGGSLDYFVTEDKEKADLSLYLELAEYALNPDKLQNKLKAEKVIEKGIKNRDKFYNSKDPDKMLFNHHTAGIREHLKLGYEKPLNKLQYSKLLRLLNGEKK